MSNLSGRVESDDVIRGRVVTTGGVLTGKMSIQGRIHDRLPDYEGPYEATPMITEQFLETKDKSMLDDVTINPIPYQEVSNPYGTTVSIGS